MLKPIGFAQRGRPNTSGRTETLTSDTQAMHVQALHSHLLPAEHRSAAAKRLLELIGQAGYHPTTGFASTPGLLSTLADHGFPREALRLLTTTGHPSWLEMLDRGGTTMWERWDGIDEDGVPHASLNHMNKGTVMSFLHEYVGGIRPPDPEVPASVGYRDFVIQPFVTPEVGWARTRLHTQEGAIETYWRHDEADRYILTVEVPCGTRATIRLPDGGESRRGHGTHDFSFRYA